MKHFDDVLKNHFQTTVNVDFSMLNGLEVLDKSIDVGLNGLDLLVGEVQKWSQSVEKSVESGLQISQKTVERRWCLVGWNNVIL